MAARFTALLVDVDIRGMAVRISGINLPDQKRIEIALTSIYGIGQSSSSQILRTLNIDPGIKVDELSTEDQQSLREYIEKNLKIEGELRREIAMNIKHEKDIGTFKGTRHAKSLPVRGQRTKTNSRTVRGNVRRTAGSGRKGAAEKT